jgi:hypothetical protein
MWRANAGTTLLLLCSREIVSASVYAFCVDGTAAIKQLGLFADYTQHFTMVYDSVV